MDGIATHQSLPYGGVMATAGASTLAAACGLRWAVAPLLALAVLQAMWIAAAAAIAVHAQHRNFATILKLSTADRHTGLHTVPLGLAVIAAGIAHFGAADTASWLPLASACLTLAWLLTILCVGRCLSALVLHGVALRRFDGTWFLVPASLLGIAIATVEVARSLAGPTAAALDLLGLIAAVIGWAGYWVVVLVASVRLERFGLGGVPRSPWWIAMGCAGLAAAALGRVLNSGAVWPPPLRTMLMTQVAVTALCGVILCTPIAFYGAYFLLRGCRFRGSATWTPTFSTAVFALGCLQASADLELSWLRILGLAAGFATLALWAATMLWNTKCQLAGPEEPDAVRIIGPRTPS